MGDLIGESNNITPFTAILWCFYPMAVLVLAELILRATDGDDDDDQGGGKMVGLVQPVQAGA